MNNAHSEDRREMARMRVEAELKELREIKKRAEKALAEAIQKNDLRMAGAIRKILGK